MGVVEPPAPHSADVAVPASPTGSVGPLRTCVGCRAVVSASALLRVIALGGGTTGSPVALAVDIKRRQPGRGAWMHSDPACFAAAVRRRAFGRALRIGTTIDPAAVGQYVESLARDQVASSSAMASTTPFPKAE